jgi:hypothetical protein
MDADAGKDCVGGFRADAALERRTANFADESSERFFLGRRIAIRLRGSLRLRASRLRMGENADEHPECCEPHSDRPNRRGHMIGAAIAATVAINAAP